MAAGPAGAQTAPAAETVKAVPPAGIALKEADRRQLEAELSTLAQEMKRLRARPELAPLTPDVEIYYRAVDGAFRFGEFFSEDDVVKARALLATGRERAKALASGRAPWLEQPGPTALGYRIEGRRVDPALRPVPAGALEPAAGRALAAGHLVSRSRREAVGGGLHHRGLPVGR